MMMMTIMLVAADLFALVHFCAHALWIFVSPTDVDSPLMHAYMYIYGSTKVRINNNISSIFQPECVRQLRLAVAQPDTSTATLTEDHPRPLVSLLLPVRS